MVRMLSRCARSCGLKASSWSRKLDLMTFQPWLQKSTKRIPGDSIWCLSGLGSRSQENHSQEPCFDDFPALAQEVDETSPGKLDLMTSWPWLQTSRKPEVGALLSRPWATRLEPCALSHTCLIMFYLGFINLLGLAMGASTDFLKTSPFCLKKHTFSKNNCCNKRIKKHKNGRIEHWIRNF